MKEERGQIEEWNRTVEKGRILITADLNAGAGTTDEPDGTEERYKQILTRKPDEPA